MCPLSSALRLPRRDSSVLIFVFAFTASATLLCKDKSRPHVISIKDVCLDLNSTQLLPQMLLAALLSMHRRNGGLEQPFTIYLFSYCLSFCPALKTPYATRLSPPASALASSSPAAPPPTRPLLVKKWRFTVCLSWISTPLKVRLRRNIKDF